MHSAAHSSSQALGGGPPGLITPHCETLWCSLCGRSAGRSDSCASREPPLQDWLDNWQLRGIPCGPISSRVCEPHLMTLPVLRGFGCWGLMSMCGITRTDADEGPVSSPASWTTRGEDHPTALDPFQGQKERHRRSTPRRHQRPGRLSHRQARWRRSR